MAFYGSSMTYHKPEGETTQWEDILAEKGIIPRRQDIEKAFDEVVTNYIPQEDKNPYEGQSLSEVEDIDDEYLSDDDKAFLEEYKKKRMAELQVAAEKNKFGYIINISRSEFIDHVTRASNDCFVVCLLYKDSILECKLMLKALEEVAERNPDVKFVKILSTDCIQDFPDKNLPCLLVYHNQSIIKQYIGLEEFGGRKLNSECIEWVLQGIGCVQTSLEEDPRLQLKTVIRRL